MTSVMERTAGDAVEPYVLQCRKAVPRMACDLVMKAIGDPNVFVFGELLALPSIQAVRVSTL